MGLLLEIRDLAADDTVPLERVLLRCMVLADALGDENLMQWVAQELNGYAKRGELPDYRIGHGQARASVTNGVRYEQIVIAGIQLPPEATEDDYIRLNAIYFTDGVRELEANQQRSDLVQTLDTDLERMVEQNLRGASGYWIRDAYKPIPPGAMAGVLGSIRSRVLQYIFRLRKDYPELDQNEPTANAPSPAALSQIFQVAIGQGSAVAIGGGSAYAQNIGQQIVPGNLESLTTYLQDQGIEHPQLTELEAVIVESSAADLDDEQSGLRKWIGEVAEKASAGGKELAKTATKELLQVAIRYYFGEFIG
jgi:hypothetical protein